MHQVALAENKAFSDGLINKHKNLSGLLRSLYKKWVKKQGVSSANRNLTAISESLTAEGLPFSVSMYDEEIKNSALAEAKCCDALAHRFSGEIDLIVEHVKKRVELMGVEWPVKILKKDTQSDIRAKNIGAVERASCDRWWRGRLRKKYSRQVESILRAQGFVKKKTSPYVSNFSLQRFKEKRVRNRGVLERLEIECVETDEVLCMADAVDASVSNPENMRNELMVRMRGWEEIAIATGLEGVLFTLTAPSKYHATLHTGRRNPKFNGSTPLETMSYLNGVWSRIRADWARKGIKALGFRVAEPHADGTPHFHLLLFFAPCELEKAKLSFGCHALAEDGSEAGAAKHRWDYKDIDPAKGTAAGYVAKYVAKNIDGHGVDWDHEGEVSGEEGAIRVKAWASIWGIRQFQQIGNASVTVWRELRRRRDPLEDWEPEEAEAIRQAADDNDWAKFVELMGGDQGAFAGREQQALRALHVQKPEPNSYGDYLSKVIGVVMRGASRAAGNIITRHKVWRVQEFGTAERRSIQVGALPPPLDLCQ